MAMADLVPDGLTTELLRGTIAAQGIFGTFLGPWSAGSAVTYLLRATADGNPAGTASYVVGGTGALTALWPLLQGSRRRDSPIVEVTSIKVKDGVASGVVLANGDEIEARASFLMPIRNARCWGLSSRSIWIRASCKNSSITA